MAGWRSVRAQVPALLALAVPIIAGLAASMLINVTDSLMIAPLGTVALAAVGLTGAIATMHVAAIYGLLSALSVRIGFAHGAGEGRAIAALMRNGMALGAGVGALAMLVMGVIWFLLPLLGQPPEVLAAMPGYYAAITCYMIPFGVLMVFKASFEAVGRPWLGTGLALFAVVVNVPLNYMLIWGIGPFPELGLTGAGIASVLAEGVALALAWMLWSWAPSLRRMRIRAALSLRRMRAVAVEGAPLGLMYLVETAAVAVVTVLIGTFGTVALAGNQVAMAVGGVVYMIPLGVAGAVAIRVAQERGAGNLAALRPVAFAALSVATVWLSGSAVLFAFGGRWLAGLVVADPAVVATAASILLVFALAQVFDGVQSTMVGALRGLSDTAWPAGVSILAYWVFALPLGWVLAAPLGLGPGGIWLGWIMALAWAGGMLTWRFLRKTG